MGLLNKFFGQTRKPEGILGKFMVNTMNPGHAKLADWGMAHLPERQFEHIADLGCGGGRNVGELLKRYPDAHVTGVDYSGVSVTKAAEHNRHMITAGRCTIQQGDVSDLKLPEGSFDLVTAFETIYFWPGLEKCFAQAARILKPGGVFLICNESDGHDATGQRFSKIIDGMRVYTAKEIEAALKAAGFQVVVTDHHPSNPWITVLAGK